MQPLRLLLMAMYASLSIIAFSVPASASILDVLGVTEDENKLLSELNNISSRRLDEFFNGADRLSNELLNRGANEGRLGLVQAGNEMQVIIRSARSQFGNELTGQIKDASAALQPFLAELQNWRDAEAKLLSSVIELEDSTAIDLGRLPLAKDYFGIRRITGTVMIEHDKSVYPILVTGDNFGAAITGQDVAVKATFDGIVLDQPKKIPPHQVQFAVPATLLAGRFRTDKLVALPLHVTVTRTRSAFLGKQTDQPLELEVSVSLLPELVGDLIVQTVRPRFSWIPDDPKVVSSVITDDTLLTFDRLAHVSSSDIPSVGDKKYGAAVTPSCAPEQQTAWRLPNGNVIPESHVWFQKGWSSSSYVGEPEGPDWSKFDREAQDQLGFNINFCCHSRCGHGSHCNITPDEIKGQSLRTTMDLGDCNGMRMAEQNFTDNDHELTVWVRGHGDHPSKWTITAPTFRWDQLEMTDDAAKSFPVYASKPVEIILPKDGRAVTHLTFKPRNGIERTARLPQNIDHGPSFVDQQDYGANDKLFEYVFHYSSGISNVY